jgi:hypothetical protein
MKTLSTRYSFTCLLVSLLLLCSPACEDFVEIDPPTTDLIKKTVFEDENTAEAAMLDLYYSLRVLGFSSGSLKSITYLASVYSDEQLNYYTGSPELTIPLEQFAENELLVNNSYVLSLWSEMYKCIYKANSILEGISSSSSIPEGMKLQLEGEAKFVRAFSYFYLVNLFGDIPLILSTDYRANSDIGRTLEGEVYQQIISDLKDASEKLSDSYTFANDERVRANKFAAKALLARAFLFNRDWEGTEAAATEVINASSLYELATDLTQVMTKNNKEAIWQLWSDFYPNELLTFYIFGSSPFYGALRPEFIENFEANDARLINWIGNSNGYYFARKYSSFTLSEYATVIRLSELYLIRAEARAQLDDIAGSQDDLNMIRLRAGLGETSASDQSSLLLSIDEERERELFTEWGHRWFDLKRTDKADQVLSALKPQWSSTDLLLPIPEYEIRNNASLKNAQNPGY